MLENTIKTRDTATKSTDTDPIPCLVSPEGYAIADMTVKAETCRKKFTKLLKESRELHEKIPTLEQIQKVGSEGGNRD